MSERLDDLRCHAEAAQARDQVRRFSAQAAGIDGHAFAQHIVLGAMIFDEADVTCSHCYGYCSEGSCRARVRLNASDPFWFQYCVPCGRALDEALTRLTARRRK